MVDFIGTIYTADPDDSRYQIVVLPLPDDETHEMTMGAFISKYNDEEGIQTPFNCAQIKFQERVMKLYDAEGTLVGCSEKIAAILEKDDPQCDEVRNAQDKRPYDVRWIKKTISAQKKITEALKKTFGDSPEKTQPPSNN